MVYSSHVQLTVDELQTEMIAETNRKRRRLGRERRALERQQPNEYIVLASFVTFIAVRRIPLPPTDSHLLPQPSLRKLVKAYPFGVHKPLKRQRHPRNQNLVYLEILPSWSWTPTMTLSSCIRTVEFLRPMVCRLEFRHRFGHSLLLSLIGAAWVLWGFTQSQKTPGCRPWF